MRTILRWLLRAVALGIVVLATLVVGYRWIDPPGTPLMAIRRAGGATLQRDVVPLERIAPALARAVIAAEDNRFCTHAGIDLDAVREAIEDNEDGGRQRGASTITMQVARNLFLWPGGGWWRKAVEAPLSLAIDALWPKRRILEVYLGIAEWGDGVFGAEAAARHHFRKAAADLTRAEAIRLAIVLPSPRRWDPARPTPFLRGRASAIDRRIDQLGPRYFACLG
ncbi:MAG: monofunctional biosynthetic peptidoglycan transglycosylase [Alphaproteobacteria bacterium]|nr:monofunctional biosynthetic peptidoglycan transglycosylase [Alphaproteobacteria bacterium]